MLDIQFSGKKGGKQFLIYQRFISAVKSGKKAIVYGYDYVVIDKKTWESVNKQITELRLLKIKLKELTK